jgi:hypothetical protein
MSYALPSTPAPELPLLKIRTVAAAIIFSALLVYAYFAWLAPRFGYFGFSLNSDDYPALWLSLPLLFFTALTLPVVFRTFSDFFMWMIFYFLYAPIMLYAPLQQLDNIDTSTFVVLTTLSFHIMRKIGNLQLRRPRFKIEVKDFTLVFFAVYAALSVFVIAVFGGNLNFAGFYEVYDQRSVGSDVLEASPLVGYATGILSGAMNPFLIAVGLADRKKAWLFIGALGQAFIYATSAGKIVLLSLVFLPAFYFGLARHKQMTADRLGLIVVCSMLLPLSLLESATDPKSGWQMPIASVILMRTYGLAGICPGIYAEFFAINPLTYYSHINIVSTFIDYPYHTSVGQIIGEFGFKFPGLNANASFWATDGIAALGLFGILVSGALMGGFLLVANALMNSDDNRVAYLASIPFITSVCNASLFLSLLTNGGLVLLLSVYLWQEANTQR